MPASSQFAAAEKILRDAIADKVSPGAAFGVLHNGQAHSAALGHLTYDPGSPAVTVDTLYDVASLTKVVATTSMAMILHDRNLLDIATPLDQILPAFNPLRNRTRSEVTLRMLLTHSSGLPAHEYLDQRCRTRDEALAACLSMPLAFAPGSAAVYSDIGYILLGLALEKIAASNTEIAPLDSFCHREIFQPLGMTATLWVPPPSLRAAIPPTQAAPLLQGTVGDGNAAILGGVAGHAGLFSSVPDLLRFAKCILSGGRTSENKHIFKPETISLFTTRGSTPPGTSRALGWDTPSAPSSSGQYFSPHSAGHLGYTGTSLWLDLDRSLAVVLLTNRTWPDTGTPQAPDLPDRQQPIRRLRPAFHDAILQALLLQ